MVSRSGAEEDRERTIPNQRGGNRQAVDNDPRAARDLAVAVVGVAAATAIALCTQMVDRSMAMFVAVPVATTVFSWRRYRDAASARHKLAELSMLDSLTGLHNRRSLPKWYERAVERAARTSSPLAVLFVDLDRFKAVNDTYGHDSGDLVIATIARRLRSAVRPSDRVIRYGGDEFVVLCNDIVTPPTATRIADRIIGVVEEPIDVNGAQVTLSASVGISIVNSRQCTMDQVLTTADSAMYRAKASGTGRCVILEPDETKTDSSVRLIDELRKAIEDEQFVLHYQPVVSLADKSMIGVEALLRWQHPERGLLLPGMFVEELEETELIVPVGAWVLAAAARQARAWQDGWPDRHFQVAVNVSTRQLADDGFPALVTQTLRETGVRPSRLCFEITEGSIMEDIDGAWATLRSAKERGIALALDDFGTGYSSLSYLRRFKTDVLKIDRTFVAGMGRGHEDRAIVEHVIGLAHSLGMTTVAEGIEREDQYDQLVRFGCDHGQGFWFSQAQPPDVITRLLDVTTRRTDFADFVLASSSATDMGRSGGASLPSV
jgi:diguanylate cyclase (GGDEF)-like protein